MDREQNSRPEPFEAAINSPTIRHDVQPPARDQQSLDGMTVNQPTTLNANEQGSIPSNLNDQTSAFIDARSEGLEAQPATVVPSQGPQQPLGNSLYSNSGAQFVNKGSKRRVVSIAVVMIIVLLLIAGMVVKGFLTKDEAPTTANSKKTVTNLDNEDLLTVGTNSGVQGASKVTINGPLRVNDRLVVNPSEQPKNAEAGQLYFDQGVRQFAYFDGQNFQFLVSNTAFSQLTDFSRATAGAGLLLNGGTLNNSGVLSLQGQTGDVNLTGSRGIAIDGTEVANTGVLSLQGSTGDVNLTAGSGIALNGLQINNTGVTALNGTADQVSVSAASGSIVLSLPQSIAATSAPTFGGLTLSSALGIGSGGTGNTTYSNNGVVYFDGTKFVSTGTPAAGLCLVSDASGIPEFGSCSGVASVTSLNNLTGGINLIAGAGISVTTVGNDLEITAQAAAGVTSLNGLNGALNVANATTAGSTITINDASTTQKGLAQFNGTDFTVTGGNVALDATITKRGNNVNGANQLVLLDSSGFLPTLNGSLLQSLNAGNITTGTLTVARGGTGTSTFNTNGVLYGNGTGAIQATAAGVTGQCLLVDASGVPYFGTCTGAGGVSSVNNKNSAVTIQGGTGVSVDNSGATIVLNNTGVTQLLGTAGQVNVSTATGSVTLSLPQAIGMTSNVTFNQAALGANGSTAGKLVLNGSTSNSVSLVAPASPTAGLTFVLPSTDGAANECLRTDGSGQLSFSACIGGGSGGGISGTGSTNQLAKFTAGQVLGNSNISDDGSTVTINSGAAIQGSAGLFIGSASVAGNLALSDGSNNRTNLKAASTSADITFTLPDSVGSVGQCIKTDGSGNLSFGNCLNGGAGSGVSQITGTASGSSAASGSITINDAATDGSSITINTATTSVKGIASFNAANFDLTAGAVSIKADGVALGTNTTGNYVASIAAGNGIQGSGTGEGSTPTISLGPLTSNWNQTGAFDIVLGNANSQLRILESSGDTYYGSIDVGDLTADRTYTFPDASGTVCLTSGNCIGSGGGISSTGTNGHLALFNGNGYTLADSVLSQSGTTVTVSGTLTATNLQGNGSGISSLNAGNIATGTVATARGGTGLDASVAANGQLLIGNGAGFSLANLTAGTGITIANTAGGINISAPNSGTCSGCAGAGDVVNSLLGTTGGSAAVKGALTINDALTNGTSVTINTASTSVKGIASFSSSNFDVSVGGAVSIKNDAIALGTQTTGNYVAVVAGGNGLTVTGSGAEGASVNVALALKADKGLVVDAGGLGLMNCTTDQVLKYDATGKWICATDAEGSAGISGIGALDGQTKNANGAAISGTSLYLQTADATNVGLVSTGAQTFAGTKTFSNISVTGTVTAGSLQGNGSAITNLNAGNITTGTLLAARGGTGVDASAATNGQLLIGNGSGFSLAALTQGTGIVITNSAGGISISAPNSGTCSGCAGAGDVVNSIIGSVTGSTAIKGALTLNDSSTSGSAITINTATTTVKGIASFDTNFFNVTSGNVSIKDDSIALGTKTTGNYVASVTGGDGLSVTGSGSEGAGVTVNLNIQANKGLKADADGLGLVACTTGQILKYNASGQWICDVDGAGIGAIGTLDSLTKSANGAVINGSTLVLQTADTSVAGLVSTGTQSFAGAKTFTGNVTVQGTLMAPGTGGAESLRVGTGSVAAGSSSSAYGVNALAYGDSSLALGSYSSAGNVNNSSIGSAIAIGSNTTASASNAIAIGRFTDATGSSSLAVGSQAAAYGNGSIAIGRLSKAFGEYSTAIGRGAVANNDYSIALGAGASTTANSQFVAGGIDGAINDIYFGNGVTNAAPSGFTLQATGGSGTNVAGGATTIAGGKGTGSAAGGNINLQISAPGAAGSSNNSLTTVQSINGSNGAVTFKNAANSTAAFQIQNTTGTALFNADTSAQRIAIGSATSGAARLSVTGDAATPGANWTSRSAPTGNWRSVAYGNGLFVAVASSAANYVMTSPDGITWTTRTVPSGSWTAITYGNGQFVAVGGSSAMTSPDGITWTTHTATAANNMWFDVIYANGLYVATTGNDTSNTTGGGAMTSPDGINWTVRNLRVSYWYGVAYGNGKFVAAGDENRAALSSDGITWTSQAMPTGDYRAITYGNGLFVAVNSVNSTSAVATSPDGITWTTQTTPSGSWQGITYANGRFVAVGDGTNAVMTSVDGITWTANNAPLSMWEAVTYANGRFVAVATSGSPVMTSDAGYDTAILTQGGIAIGGFASFTNDANIQGSLSVRGSTTLQGGLTVTGNTSVQGTLTVIGNASIFGDLSVNGALRGTDLYTGLSTVSTNLRIKSDGTLQNVLLDLAGATVKTNNTTAGVLYVDANGVVRTLNMSGQNNNCVGVSADGLTLQYQGCSGSGGGATGFSNGANNYTANPGTATTRIATSFDATITNPVLGLTSNSALDIVTNNSSRINIQAGGDVSVLSNSGNSTSRFTVRNQNIGNSAQYINTLVVSTTNSSGDDYGMGGRVGIGLLVGTTPQVTLDIGGGLNNAGGSGLQVRASIAPGLSNSGNAGAGTASTGRIYYDQNLRKFMVSENGGAYTALVAGGGATPILQGGNNGGDGTGGSKVIIGNKNANSNNLLIGTAINNGTISTGMQIDFGGRYLFDKPYNDNDEYGFKIGGGSGTAGSLHIDTRYGVVVIGEASSNSTTSYGKLVVGGTIMASGFRAGPGGEQVGINAGECGSTQGLRGVKFEQGLLVKTAGCTGTYSDIAETYASVDSLEAGELVATDPANFPNVRRTTGAAQNNVMGIVSTQPDQVLGGPAGGYPIALVGRVPTKVNLEGGPILPGDKITASSVPGVGKKATGAGMVVGTALQAYDGSNPNFKPEVFVGTSYYSPIDANNLQAQTGTFGDLNVSGMTTLTNLTVNGNATFKGNITVNGHIISAGNTPTVTGVTDATTTVEGTDTAGTVTVTVTNPVAAGSLSAVTFSTPYDKAPRVNITPDNAAAAGSKYYTTGRATTGFTIGVGELIQPGIYTYNYQVIQ